MDIPYKVLGRSLHNHKAIMGVSWCDLSMEYPDLGEDILSDVYDYGWDCNEETRHAKRFIAEVILGDVINRTFEDYL